VTAPKVLHLIANLEIGGTERQLVEFIRRSSEPYRHHVATFYGGGPLAGDLPHPVIRLSRRSRRRADLASMARTVVPLRRVIRAGAFDLVHAHLGLSEVLAAVGTPKNVPVVASRRGPNIGFDANGILKLAEGLGHRRTATLICNAEVWAQRARDEDLWTPRTVVVPNGVDLDRFTPSPPPVGPPTVAVVANLHPYKGHERFLRGFALMRRRIPDARAILVGDGVERPRLASLVADLDLSGGVTFTGQVADPRRFLRDAHVVALTSDFEGLPNALLEAMAMARPVVATRVGGVPEVVDDGVTGLLVPRDAGAIAGALERLLPDDGLRARLGGAARSHAERFAWSNVVARTEVVYEQVVGTSRSRTRDPQTGPV
jgi:glycosyltransferase involved in cell wall biosynthesis